MPNITTKACSLQWRQLGLAPLRPGKTQSSFHGHRALNAELCSHHHRKQARQLVVLALLCYTSKHSAAAFSGPNSGASIPQDLNHGNVTKSFQKMKQKIVIKVQVSCDRCRSKALALVAAAGGVDSVALAGDARDQVVVVGDGVDSIGLTEALRKKVGPAQLLQVAEANAEKKPAPAPAPTVPDWSWHWSYPPPPPPVGSFVYGYQTRPDSICSIL